MNPADLRGDRGASLKNTLMMSILTGNYHIKTDELVTRFSVAPHVCGALIIFSLYPELRELPLACTGLLLYRPHKCGLLNSAHLRFAIQIGKLLFGEFLEMPNLYKFKGRSVYFLNLSALTLLQSDVTFVIMSALYSSIHRPLVQ